MGTSSSNPGQNGHTPLVPSWLDDADDLNTSMPLEKNNEDEKLLTPDRFSRARNNFTRFVNSGGSNKYLKSASKSYVKTSLGGAKNATKRLGSGLGSTNNLIGVLSTINRQGLSNTLRNQGLGDLVGMPLSDVFIALIDNIVPSGGRVDEGIARDALDEAIIDFTENMGDSANVDEISSQQLEALVEGYIVNVIQKRLINDIGANLIKLSGSVEEINHIQEQISDFIQGAVSDSISSIGESILNVNDQQVSSVVRQIYTEAYNILGSIEEE